MESRRHSEPARNGSAGPTGVRGPVAAPLNGHRDRAAIREWLTVQIADLLGVPPQKVDPRESFTHYGLSSAEAVILAGDLGDWLGRDLPPTLAWDHPTIEALAAHLAPDDAGVSSAATPSSAPGAAAPRR